MCQTTSGDRQLCVAYTAAPPYVSVGSYLRRHEGMTKVQADKSRWRKYFDSKQILKKAFLTMAKMLSWRFRHLL